MKIQDILDLTLGEVLDKYGLLYNPECDYMYGFIDYELAEQVYEEYDIDVYKEAIYVDTLIPSHILTDYHEEFLTYENLEKIMKNLDIPKKKKVEE